MSRRNIQKVWSLLQGLKLEFLDPKMEQSYRSLKEKNMAKDFQICLGFLVVYNVWVLIVQGIYDNWTEAYIAIGTIVALSILYPILKHFPNYIQPALLVMILAYTISRLVMLQSYPRFGRSGPFNTGYTMCTMQAVLVFRLEKFSHKSFGIIVLLGLRYLILSVYVDPGSFSWTLFTRHCCIDAFVLYTFYNNESVFRKIYQGFTQKEEELLKFKELIAESLPQSLVVLACEKNSFLFSNKTFQSTFNITTEDFEALKTQLEKMVVDFSTIRETATHNCSLIFKKDSKDIISLAEILERFESDNDLNDKAISLAASTIESEVRRLFEVTLKKVKWDNKDAIAVLFNDITYQENLITLKMANINKDKVIATVSHELRTPLNGIIGILDITKKKAEDPQIVEYLSLCKDNANLLLSLVNSILDLQQISAGKLKLNPANVDIRKVVGSIAQLFYFQCKEKNISFECDIQDEVPKTISTDENRLKQVLINLLGNAIKFTRLGGVKVTIALNPDNPDNLHISVSDSGIGIKQEDQNRLFKMYGKIEDGESVNKHGVGLGLTISNALAMLLNGGSDTQGIRVDSQYGSGSRFYFQIQKNLKEKKFPFLLKNEGEAKSFLNQSLNESETSKAMLLHKPSTHDEPRYEEDCLAQDYGHSSDMNEFFSPSNINSKLSSYSTPKRVHTLSIFKNLSGGSHSREVLSSHRTQELGVLSPLYQKQVSAFETVEPGLDILIVDDNPFNLLVAKSLIQEFKCNIQTALGGHEALEAVRKSLSKGIHFKVIFMDCQMPIMDGFEATKALKAMMKDGQIPEVPIFGWTANNSEEDVKRCYEAGMIGHLPKPASKLDFSKVLSRF